MFSRKGSSALPVAGLELMAPRSVAKGLTLSRHRSRHTSCVLNCINRTDNYLRPTFFVFSTSVLFIYLCITFMKRFIHNLICSKMLHKSYYARCTFHKFAFADVCVSLKLHATVELNFDMYTECQLKTNDNYHSIHSHSMHSYSGCILTWVRICRTFVLSFVI